MDIFGLLAFEGTYAGGTTYADGDVVAYNSSSYVSLLDGNVGNQPDISPTKWALLAAQGATGATGPAGPGMRYGKSAGGSIAFSSLAAGAYLITVQYTSSSDTASVSGQSSTQYSIPGSLFNQEICMGVYTLNSSGTLTVTTATGNLVTITPVTT